jgi:hypothetical protein
MQLLGQAVLFGALSGEAQFAACGANLAIAAARASASDDMSGEGSSVAIAAALPASADGKTEALGSEIVVGGEALRSAAAAAAGASSVEQDDTGIVDVVASLYRFSPYSLLAGLGALEEENGTRTGDNSTLDTLSILSPVLSLSLTRDGVVLDDEVSTAGLNAPVANFTLSLFSGAPAEDDEELACVYFDEARQAWSQAGVQTAAMSGGALRCASYHLTDFAARRVSASADSEPQRLVSTNEVSGEQVATVLGRGPRASIP